MNSDAFSALLSTAQGEYEALKRQCEALIEENGRLKAELEKGNTTMPLTCATCGCHVTDGQVQTESNPSDEENVGANVDARAAEIQVPPPIPFEDELPQHIASDVCRACFELATHVAHRGLDERRPHHGFTVIVGDENALKTRGHAGFNQFQGHNFSIVDDNGQLDKASFDILRRYAFAGDGAIVIDGLTGRVVSSGWFVGDISLGGFSGGSRSRSAMSIAQQAGGCFVIKCSEDSDGELIVHMGEQIAEFPRRVGPDNH